MTGCHFAALSDFLADHALWMYPSLNVKSSAHFYPSEDYIRQVFVDHVRAYKDAYDSALHHQTSKVLACDHTFQICSNVGYQQGDGKWITLFDSLFVVMNCEGQVLDFRMVASRSFEAVQAMLQDVNHRGKGSGSGVETVIVDNCCQWAAKLREVFGPTVHIKLDLFHAVQRLTKAMCHQHKDYHRATADLRLCFRETGDADHERRRPTSAPDVMRTKLLQFQQRWSTLDDEATPLLKADFNEDLQRLLVHVQRGCLAGIPPGWGTSRNERLHRLLNNSAANVPRIGPELMDSLLTVIFYAWNKKRQGLPLAPIDTGT